MKLKGYVKYIFPIAILAIMVFAFQPMPVMAEEETTTDTEGEPTETEVEDEGPALNNASQVLRAERISEASATGTQEDVDSAQDALTAFGTDSDTAYDDWQAALAEEEATPDTYTEAELAAMEKLYNDVLAAEGTLADATSNLAGTSVAEIEAMRADGMGWGEICHFLGLHPSINGHGQFKFKNKFGETTEATVRNKRTGLAKGHGVNANNGNGNGNNGNKGNNGNNGNKGNKGNKGKAKG
ncbi:MAG: hypothetical protein JRJ27_10700, partial [Deltaproteobacteria bacterium]|nr:hypothetical protein [Deltaproteobacteria bacterium]